MVVRTGLPAGVSSSALMIRALRDTSWRIAVVGSIRSRDSRSRALVSVDQGRVIERPRLCHSTNPAAYPPVAAVPGGCGHGGGGPTADIQPWLHCHHELRFRPLQSPLWGVTTY